MFIALEVRFVTVMSAKGMGQVFNKIVRVLDTDREADKIIGDPELSALLRGDGSMGHDGRVLDEALDSAETFCEGEDTAALEKAAGLVEAAFDQNCHHSAEAIHLPFRELMLRMRR